MHTSMTPYQHSDLVTQWLGPTAPSSNSILGVCEHKLILCFVVCRVEECVGELGISACETLLYFFLGRGKLRDVKFEGRYKKLGSTNVFRVGEHVDRKRWVFVRL